ncbi:MAG: HK97 family phage prohead protease [Burkholderiaceae bacterium]|nr:HK97 family phage prohead protease [Burkholderiaceae bacterium]MBY0467614.1 HK97 family phage prohead protease [Burkholderiaceae bacterium]
MTRDYIDCAFECKAVNDDGTFEGYGSVFGVVDSYQEVVAAGAFTESLSALKQQNRMPALLWQHRSGEPIGVYTEMREDSIGLHVKGKLALKTARGAEAHELLKMKALSGLSIGFMTREDSYDKLTGVRTLKKLDLWEVSLVTFPANDAARVSAVKTIESINTLADAESYLRESGGLTKSQAVGFIARVKSLQGRSESDELGELGEAIQRLSASLN